MTEIVTIPNPILRTPAKSVDTIDKKILDIISRMRNALKTAKNPSGVGLAAPQIGEPYRIFLLWPQHSKEPQLIINPEILVASQRMQSPLDVSVPKSRRGVYEGCLSIPHHYAPLSRSLSVTLKYQAISENSQDLIDKTEIFTGFPAHIVQHEVDHLNGLLFIDRVLQQNTKLYRVQGKTWEEISL